MEDLRCIIHYKIKDARYNKIKSISDINKEKTYDAKRIRESKGGAHHHEAQCMTILNEIDPNEHGIHLEPCYKKFVLIISQEKERSFWTVRIFLLVLNVQNLMDRSREMYIQKNVICVINIEL